MMGLYNISQRVFINVKQTTNYAILTEQRNARPGILHLIVIEINAIWVRLIYIRYI